jgi:glycosyltransferase involved in cell wall biosynthesis
MRILALMKYGTRAASTRQRLLQYLPFLERHGIEVEVSPLLDDAHVARIAAGGRSGLGAVTAAYARRLAAIVRMRRFDLIWLHCELLPYLPSPTERLVRFAGRPVLLDYDDAIFHMYDAHPNRLVRAMIGRKFEAVVRSADVVLAGSAYLADYARRFNQAVTLVPTVVDTARYEPVSLSTARVPVVGWMGSPSTWRYVEPLLSTLLPTLARLGVRLRVVGGGPAARGIDGVDAIEWNESTEVMDIQAMDIGLMPLPDAPWARGKCGYKLIQYMACGLPVIASPVGVNVSIVDDGQNGFLARTAADWDRALETLLADRLLRRRMGVEGRQKVIERYSLASQQPVVLAALKDALLLPA